MREMRTDEGEVAQASGPLSPSQVAQRVGVSTATVYRWIGDGRLGAVRVGGQWRVLPEDIAAMLAEGTRARLGRYVEPEYAVPVRPR